MERKEAPAPRKNSRNSGRGNSTRSPQRPQQHSNRASYNYWASRRGNGPANNSHPNNSVTNSENHQRHQGNVRPLENEPESPETLSPVSNEDGLNGSCETGLQRIGQLLEEIDSSIPDDNVITLNDTPQTGQSSHQIYNDHPPLSTQPPGLRPIARLRRRLPLHGGTPSRGNSHGARNPDSGSTSTNPIQAPQSNPSPLQQNRPNALRIGRNIPPPLVFRSTYNGGELSPDSSDDLSSPDANFAASRPEIRPLQANGNPFLQGLGTEDDPFELSPDVPNIPANPFRSDSGTNRDNRASNSSSDNGSFVGASSGSRRRRGSRGRFGNGRSGGIGLVGTADRNSTGASLVGSGRGRVGAGVVQPLSSLTEVQSPPISDEELARRLQEEEWEAASVRDDDDLEAAMLRNLDSPLHLYGGYHRRRPRWHLPPLMGMDEGSGAASGSESRPEENYPFFFDGPPPRGRERRGQRLQRGLPNLPHPLQAFFDLRRDDSFLFDFIAHEALINSSEEAHLLEGDENSGRLYESLLALADQIGEVSQGLTPAEINRFPTRKHKSPSVSENDGASSGGATGGVPLPSDQLQCSICLCDYENGDQKRLLPCKHDFHKDCIDTWLKTKASCPVCRSDVKPKRS